MFSVTGKKWSAIELAEYSVAIAVAFATVVTVLRAAGLVW